MHVHICIVYIITFLQLRVFGQDFVFIGILFTRQRHVVMYSDDNNSKQLYIPESDADMYMQFYIYLLKCAVTGRN